MNKTNTIYLTRRQAWKKIQEAFKFYATGRGKASNMAYAGLCHSVDILLNKREITREVDTQMRHDIRSVKPFGCQGLWYWPTSTYIRGKGREGAAARVKAVNKILRRKTK